MSSDLGSVPDLKMTTSFHIRPMQVSMESILRLVITRKRKYRCY